MSLPYDQRKPFFMCIKDGQIKKFRGSLGTHLATLTKMNRQGYGIYFCAAEMGDSDQKTKINVKETNVLWADMDDGPLPDDFSPAPNITVQTSPTTDDHPGKFQYYWRLKRSINNLDKIEEMLGRVIAKAGADPKCRDACRLMRVPGFANQKNGYDVVLVKDDGGDYLLPTLEKEFPEIQHEYATPSTVVNGEVPVFDVHKAVMDMVTGKDIHGSRTALSLSLANTGLKEQKCLELIDGLLDAGFAVGKIDQQRYTERKANNQQVVNTAYLKIHGELPVYEFDDHKGGSLYTKMPPLPIGGLKTLVDDIMSNMYYPVYEVAVPLAMHLIGVFGSGGYHLDGVTGTKRRAICMKSGSGKDIVTNYIFACINELADARADNFTGANSFTPRTVHAELKKFRCRSYVVSEAGIAGQSETGDVANMRAYMLQALAAKAGRPLSIRATTTDIKQAKDENIPLNIHGTVINVLAESTIETYAKMMNLSHADVTGMMGREELIYPEPNFDPDMGNRKGFVAVGEPAMEILQPLAQRFLDHPQTSGIGDQKRMFKPVDTHLIDDMLDEDYRRCSALRAKHVDSRDAVETQYTRLHEKVKCTALILAIADSPFDDPIIQRDHYEWSIKYHRALIATVTAHLSGEGSLASPMEGCIARLEKVILEYPARSKDKQLTLNLPKRLVRKAWLSAVLDITNCKPFKTLADTSYYGKSVEARKAVLQEAMDRGLITRTKYENKEAFTLAKRG